MTPSPTDEDPAFDTLLREQLGGEAPPDLTERVAARFLHGSGPAALARVRQAEVLGDGRRHGSRLLAAALVLLGVGVVVATPWLRHDGSAAPKAAAAGQDPVKVRNPATKENPGKAEKAEKPAATTDPTRSPTAAGERAFALRVVDRFGGPVQEFDMELLQVLRNTDGPPHRVRLQAPFARELRPSDFSPDYATIGDIEPGRYAVAVTAAAHGLTLSEPFEITEQGGPFVELRLAQGGELGGRILDPSGQPITGALVRTDSNLQFEGGAQQLFGPMMAARIAGLFTGAETRTDATGHFHFGKLIQNDYALHVEHPDYCPALLRNLPVSDQPLDCRAVLERGAVVHGIASIDGRPTAGLVVQVLAGGDSKKAIESATSGEDGTFRLPGRLRSGSYQIQAHRPDAKVNPFQMLIEIKQSQHAFDIGAKDREVEVDVTIATDKKLQ